LPRVSSFVFETNAGLQVVRAVRTSHIETSHRRPVTDLKWIACDSEIGLKGGRRVAKDDKDCHQLVTVASDGAMCVTPRRPLPCWALAVTLRARAGCSGICEC
jgi:hypothetical protein